MEGYAALALAAYLQAVPVILWDIESKPVVNFELFYTEPLEYCVMQEIKDDYYFNCWTVEYEQVRFKISGVYKT